MKTNVFVKQIKMQKDVEAYLKSRIVKTYIPIEDKIAACNAIVSATSHTNFENVEVYKRNSPAQFINFALLIIAKYTDIEIDFENTVGEFNALDEFDLINQILAAIPQREYNTWSRILEMANDDLFENERSLAAIVEGIGAMGSELSKLLQAQE